VRFSSRGRRDRRLRAPRSGAVAVTDLLLDRRRGLLVAGKRLLNGTTESTGIREDTAEVVQLAVWRFRLR